jgi:peptidoglycan hydrolase-like protein with peptidoglycan-binding domain
MRLRRTPAIALAAGGIVVLGGAGAAAVGIGGRGADPPPRSGLPPATTAITKTTLTETEEVEGTLGYGDTRTVSARTQGTLTWLAAEGSTVTRGRPVFKVDTAPVPLLYGTTPMYRTLRSGLEGADVRMLERNLSALGYTGFTVDDEFTAATAEAVQEWQEDLGLTETGMVQPGAVVIAAGRIRVAEHRKSEGDPASGAVLTYTGTGRIVTVDVPVEHQRLAKRGRRVEVTLPSGESAQGRISKVGTVATQPQGEEGEEGDATIEVTVTVRDAKVFGTLDQAPVEVLFEADKREDVLAVPVAALLALPNGGYGVEVVGGGGARTVQVEVGMFADGKVEISGEGLAEGMKVGIPR